MDKVDHLTTEVDRLRSANMELQRIRDNAEDEKDDVIFLFYYILRQKMRYLQVRNMQQRLLQKLQLQIHL